jgi:uncharacterized membrane protein HdeD (DUF308 family)
MKSNRIMKMIISVILIVFGAMGMIWPTFVYGIITYLIGAGLIVNGVVLLLEYFQTSPLVKERYYQLVGSILFILIGTAMLVIPVAIVQAALGLMIAIGLLVISMSQISRALIEKSHFDGWMIRLLIGIIVFLASMIVFSRLNEAGNALMFIIGGVAIYIGISNLLGTFLIKTKSKDDPEHIDIDFTKK